MDPAAREDANVPRPGATQPLNGLDSYHRLLREASDADALPGPSDRRYSATNKGSFSIPRHAPTWRIGDPSETSGSSYRHIASFFDSERLANAQAVGADDSPPREVTLSSGIRTRWPFLGSIRSRASSRSGRSARSPRSPPLPDLPPQRESEKSDSDVPRLPWRPLFLHRRVLAAFAALFAVLIAGLEVALFISNRNDGLRKTNDASRYLWQYGTTLVFTVVALVWARVEYQAKAAAPWIRMSKSSVGANESLLLDYISLPEVTAVVRALQNLDLIVICPVAAGIALKVVMVLSTAFITPSVLRASNQRISISIDAAFTNSSDGLENVGSLPYFAMAELQTTNISFPVGIASQAAYLPFTIANWSTDVLNATVDGFVGGMDCQSASLELKSVNSTGDDLVSLNLTTSVTNCTANQLISNANFVAGNESLPKYFLTFQPGSCSESSELDDQRIVVMAGRITLDTDAIKAASKKKTSTRLQGTLIEAAALICTPTYIITEVNVVKNATDLIVAKLVNPRHNSTIGEIQPWDIARAQFDSFKGHNTPATSYFTAARNFYTDQAVLASDEPMFAALALSAKQAGSPPDLDNLAHSGPLNQLAQNYFTQYSALVARFAMMDQTSTPSTAFANIEERRLIVRQIPTHIMVGFLGICLILTLVSIFAAPRRGFLPRDPGTMIDTGALLAHSRPLLQCLQGTGGASERVIDHRLKGSAYSTGVEGYADMTSSNMGFFHVFGGNPPSHRSAPRQADISTWRQPTVMTGIIRLLFALVLVVAIIGFEVSFRSSERYDGVRTIGKDNAYIAWTAIPATLVLFMAMYVDAVDVWTRIISPFTNLYGQGDFFETVGLNLIDVWKPVAWWKAMRMRDFGVLTTVSGVLFAPLLVVAISPLFDPVPVDKTTDAALRSVDFFGNSVAFSDDDPICVNCNNDTDIASLILSANASYPAFTFEDLVLQGVSLDAEDPAIDDLQIKVTLPAVRSNLTCRVYLVDQITTNLTLDYSIGDATNPLRVDLSGEPCRGKSEARSSNVIIGTARSNSSASRTDGNVFFGSGIGKTTSTPQCSDWLYVWGELADADSTKINVKSISALACNETVVTVNTDVTLHGTALQIDPAQPPVTDEASLQNTTVALATLNYSKLANISTSNLFDHFFALLTTSSRFKIPTDVLGESSSGAVEEVQSAVLRQHGIIRAQSLNQKSRRHLSSDGTFPEANGKMIVSGIDPSASVSEAVPTFDASRIAMEIRLRQDEIATRILQSFLGVVLLFHLLSWIFTPKTILPRWPTSIASVAALLADGNMLGLFPRVAEWQSKQELQAVFQGNNEPMLFELSWDPPLRDSKRDRRRKKREEETKGTFGIRVLRPPEHPLEELTLGPLRSTEGMVPIGIRQSQRRPSSAMGSGVLASGDSGRRRPSLARKGSAQGSARAWWS